MGRLDVSILRYLTRDDFRVLETIEKGTKCRETIDVNLAVHFANSKCKGANKRLRDLCQQKLLCYERGGKCDGYRLTNMGYDYLALNVLTKRDFIASFGNQIGVGKESNVYIVADQHGDELCLKLHRLGRVCFRNVANKRDYQKSRNLSWLGLSEISACKEIAFMTALYGRGFPVPKPIGSNRHCVVMELVKGIPLCQVHELDDVESLYDELMNLIVQLANSGIIHCDFNEFNIMIKEDEKPVIIDFPQMVSIAHENAETFFDRDVQCIINFFEKRFGYRSETYPKFSDIERTDAVDVEVRCSGVTKPIAKEIKKKLMMDGDASEDDETDEESGDGSESDESEEYDETPDASRVSLFSSLSLQEGEAKNGTAGASAGEGCGRASVDASFVDLKTGDEHSCAEPDSDQESDDSNERVGGRRRRFGTIEEMQRRVKREIRAKEALALRQTRPKAKGKASAARRSRKENLQTIKQSTGLWS